MHLLAGPPLLQPSFVVILFTIVGILCTVILSVSILFKRERVNRAALQGEKKKKKKKQPHPQKKKKVVIKVYSKNIFF